MENEAYVGNQADPSYDRYDEMCDADERAFVVQRDTVCEETFDFQAEICRCCVNCFGVKRAACTFPQRTQLHHFARWELALWGYSKRCYSPETL